MIETVIKIENLSKRFNIYKKNYQRFLEPIIKKKLHKEYWALSNINLEIKKGEAVGIIGANGAGKSTLLKIICGALYKTTGEVSINGRILSLLELGTGFHPELTGIENIFNSASMQGFSHQEISSKLQDIIDFADIGEHINSPVKTYSSGMYVRLAFALYACLDPDIYIVDEALSVGDVFFQQKCFERLKQMKEDGVTIIMVSHDPAPIVNFCDYAVFLNNGEIESVGSPTEILEIYNAKAYEKKSNSKQYIVGKTDKGINYGDGSVKITNIKLYDKENKECTVFDTGDIVKLGMTVENLSNDTDDICVGFQIKNRLGNIMYGTNSNWLNNKIIFKNGIAKCEFIIEANLGEGKYTFSVASANNKYFSDNIFFWNSNAIKMEIIQLNNKTFGGEVSLPVRFNNI